jgi:hypothetical protein
MVGGWVGTESSHLRDGGGCYYYCRAAVEVERAPVVEGADDGLMLFAAAAGMVALAVDAADDVNAMHHDAVLG